MLAFCVKFCCALIEDNVLVLENSDMLFCAGVKPMPKVVWPTLPRFVIAKTDSS